MTSQKKDESAFTSTRDSGTATFNWEGTELKSDKVEFGYNGTTEGLIFARYLSEKNRAERGGTENDTILLSLRSEILPEKDFIQIFNEGDQNYKVSWKFIYDNRAYDVKNGTISGRFTPGYGRIKANVTMTLTDGSTVSGKLDIYNSKAPHSGEPYKKH
ncbi:hypothetical protein OH720_04035 [Pseudomonas sp. WJP1]|uniref:hypothetical protein n=1 Tax=Pseudomonas sp. WJP1 TaxID=2986947 RepID=UPI00234B3A2C|nr:hypothetical protein [Pseudomonas sp. WJP1]WCM52198.1 hypothetical protein OH720_04035 [Pseudomonas sp. WJP1]